MEIIIEYFIAAVNAVLALFGKKPIVLEDGGLFDNLKSMFEGMSEFDPTNEATVDM